MAQRSWYIPDDWYIPKTTRGATDDQAARRRRPQLSVSLGRPRSPAREAQRRTLRRTGRGWRRHRLRRSARCRKPRSLRGADREARLRRRHLEPLEQAHPRRPPLPRTLRPRPGARSAARAAPARPAPGAAPRPRDAFPAAARARIQGPRLHGRRPPALRFSGRPQAGDAAAPASLARRLSARGAVPQGRRGHRRHPLLRCPGGRCPLRRHLGGDGLGPGRQLRAGRRGDGIPSRRRRGHRCARARPRGRHRVRRARARDRQRHRHLDHRDGAPRRRGVSAAGAPLQGGPHRRAKGTGSTRSSR